MWQLLMEHRHLIDAGADSVKIGIGPGFNCTTTDCCRCWCAATVCYFALPLRWHKSHNIPVIADGGIKFSGDIAKAIAAGASARDDWFLARRDG